MEMISEIASVLAFVFAWVALLALHLCLPLFVYFSGLVCFLVSFVGLLMMANFLMERLR